MSVLSLNSVYPFKVVKADIKLYVSFMGKIIQSVVKLHQKGSIKEKLNIQSRFLLKSGA